VQVASELWSARSSVPISKGSRVRVVSRQGFVLNVETIEDDKPQEVKE
jgi:membrane-bound ClpP family serine protease